jgi:outer membrane protein TolC
MQMVEKEFQNGVRSATEYASASDTYARSEADLEGVKMDFRSAYMILEIIVGMKFNIK